MKFVIMLSALMFAQMSFASIRLDCSQSFFSADIHQTKNLKTKIEYKCQSEDADYDVTLTGYSLGIHESLASTATIICPTVRKAALGVKEFTNKKGKVRRGTQTFGGVNVDVGIVAGVEVGTFANAKGGICQLIGLSILSFGVDVGGVKMKVEKVQ